MATKRTSAVRATRKWSARVTSNSDALDLTRRVFTWSDPERIARSLKRSAERSTRRKATPFQSAMAMLTFYLNRGSRNLPAERRRILAQAQDELRRIATSRPAPRHEKSGENKAESDQRAAFVFLEAATVLPPSQLHNFVVGK